jgi:hypothetical protein
MHRPPHSLTTHWRHEFAPQFLQPDTLHASLQQKVL